MINCVKYGFR